MPYLTTRADRRPTDRLTEQVTMSTIIPCERLTGNVFKFYENEIRSDDYEFLLTYLKSIHGLQLNFQYAGKMKGCGHRKVITCTGCQNFKVELSKYQPGKDSYSSRNEYKRINPWKIHNEK